MAELAQVECLHISYSHASACVHASVCLCQRGFPLCVSCVISHSGRERFKRADTARGGWWGRGELKEDLKMVFGATGRKGFSALK